MAATDIGFLTKDLRVRLHAIVDVDEVRSRPMREQFPKALYSGTGGSCSPRKPAILSPVISPLRITCTPPSR
jgi:hypothetical protein